MDLPDACLPSSDSVPAPGPTDRVADRAGRRRVERPMFDSGQPAAPDQQVPASALGLPPFTDR